jgi:sterol desaturase/sphingolipid hydroxylase (fatty acid hydroxylase superfamily)
VRLFPRFDLVGSPLVAAVLGIMLGSEAARPLRPRRCDRRARWPKNAGLGAIAGAIVRGAVVPAMVRCAEGAARRDLGILRWLPLPAPVRVAVSVLALDYTMYLWHRALHDVPQLWRFHAVHHADADLDTTTALRFHAGELAASVPFRCLQVTVLGVSPGVALTYEVAMQCAALVHHANLRLPWSLERVLGLVFVTPRMHGIHHSTDPRELASNWSVIFSFWDRLHGTHLLREAQPTIGLPAEAPPG